MPAMDSSPHPLQVMVTDFKSPEDSSPHESDESDIMKPEAPSHIQLTEQSNGQTSDIGLSGIKHPALLIDTDLKIAWQNKSAIEMIWQRIGSAKNGNPTPNIIDLIFDASFKRQVINFTSCIDFFFSQLRGFLSTEDLRERISGMPIDRQNLLSPLLDQIDDIESESDLYGGYFTLKFRKGRHISFKVAALNCDEGRLLIFDPLPADTRDHRSMASPGVADRLERIRHQPNPVLTPYFIIAAKINRASVLRTELLAEDHWRLINALYQRCLARVERYGGAFGQHVGDGFIAYFLPDQNRAADAMGVIECALEIKAEAVELGRKWRISKNGLQDIDINIGIHFEEAYVGSLPVSSSDILTSFGDGVRVAGTLCRLAGEGQIWATKPVIHQIPASKSKTVRFGILKTNNQHRKTFLKNTFCSAGSVFDLTSSGGTFEGELGYLPVTQVFDLS